MRNPLQFRKHPGGASHILLRPSAADRERQREQRRRRREGRLREIRVAKGLRVSPLLVQRRQEGLPESAHEDARVIAGHAESADDDAADQLRWQLHRPVERHLERGGGTVLSQLRHQIQLAEDVQGAQDPLLQHEACRQGHATAAVFGQRYFFCQFFTFSVVGDYDTGIVEVRLREIPNRS